MTVDVSELLVDPDFAVALVVTRSTATVGTNGLNAVTTAALNAYGVVTSNGQPFEQGADAQYAQDTIEIYSQFHFQAEAVGQLPDKVSFGGNTYTVKSVGNWTKWGAGFTVATCELLGTTEVAN